MKTKKIALVLGGGGVKGAYEAGIVDYLINEKNINFDIVCGSSAGSINGSFLAQFSKSNEKQGIEELKKFWGELKQENIYKRWFPFGNLQALWKQSLYNSKPLKSFIENRIDLNKILESGKKLQVGAVSVSTGQYQTFNETSKDLIDAIVASSSFPIFFSPHKVGNDYYFDAGVRENVPLNDAIRLGADEIYVICTDPEKMGTVDPEDLKTLDITKRLLFTMSDEILKDNLEKINTINEKVLSGEMPEKRIIKYHLVRPENYLVKDALTFKHEEIVSLIQKGFEDAKKQIK